MKRQLDPLQTLLHQLSVGCQTTIHYDVIPLNWQCRPGLECEPRAGPCNVPFLPFLSCWWKLDICSSRYMNRPILRFRQQNQWVMQFIE
jgi:hypothetical protein